MTKAMNALERELEYPLGVEPPTPGSVREVAPGIRWARMQLPFALDHINLWLLRDTLDDAEVGPGGARDGWTLVDTGIDDERTRADWTRLFETALDGLPIVRLIVTHMHPDHIGLAHWICERFGVRLWISATDYAVARRAIETPGGPISAAFMAEHGLRGDASAAAVGSRTHYYRDLVPRVPESHHRLLDGMDLTIGEAGDRSAWTCRAGYGHAPEHMALHGAARNVLVSGDMVLPRISTNISVIEVEPEADPLALYLASIGRLRDAVPADALVLPSHGLPFRGLHRRVAQLIEHHEARFADTLAACEVQAQSAFELVPVLFRRALDAHQTSFAIGESIAHLHALWHAGRLARERGSDGIVRFRALPA